MTHSPSPMSSDIPPWQPFFEAGEYRRALASARLLRSPALATIESLLSWQEALFSRRYDQAQRQLKRLQEDLEACPDPAEAAALRGQIHPERLQAALSALQRAADAQITDPPVLEAALQPAFAEPLTRAEAHNVLGVLHARQDNVALAKQQFDTALTISPQHYRVLSNLGNLALQTGDREAAEQYQRQALALNGDFAAAHHNLGVVLRKKGRLNEAVRHLKQAQRLDVRAASTQEKPRGLPHWLTPQVMRVLGLVLALLVFLVLMRGH